ncbi:MAG: nitronate monooxygenase [Desulfobacterales bacterium]|nr:nitronate monooxygenase family protein [Deltaproteobacteria bacterium]NNK85278.1 nitronate monooxygenase [Desulfobacterales bacterium]NNL41638.1 nitronate monooxygenase [Desulfobacterales bacterium]
MKLPLLRIGDLEAEVPIIQGGMSVGISLSGLASAVANEGGIGVIGTALIGLREPDYKSNYLEANIRGMRKEIRKARQMSDGIIGVNIMVVLTNFADTVRTAIDEQVDIIFAGAGLPLDMPGYLKEDSVTKLVPIISSGRAARLICKKWLSKYNYLPDAFVVEGPKAGGHIGFKLEQIDDQAFSLENIVPEVIQAVKPFEDEQDKNIPVIAAGGIYTPDDIEKFIKMGAAGVQLGTRFVATHECDADERFKQAYIESKKEDMTIIKSPVGLPGRAVNNKFLDDVTQGKKKPFNCPYHCIKTCDYQKSPYCIAFALLNAQRGNLKHGYAFAGQNAYRINEIVSVKQLIASLLKGHELTSIQQPLLEVAV